MGDLLWKKSGVSGPDADVMKFLAGEDVVLDRDLLLFDLRASAAHANGLEKIGILSKDENTRLQSALATLAEEYRSGNRKLGTEFEDGHSAIEMITASAEFVTMILPPVLGRLLQWSMFA